MYKKDFIVCDVSRTPLCNLNDNTPNCVRSIKESLSVNEITSLTFELPVVPNGKWLNIVNENLILFNNEYYKIKNMNFTHDQDGKLSLSVEAKHYSDVLATNTISLSETTPLNVIDLMKLALCYENGEPTLGWKVGNVTVDRTLQRGLEAVEQSPFSILLTIADKFDGILKFNSMDMTVDMLEREPIDRPELDLRVSKNLKSFDITYDTSEMYTRLYCYGATDNNGNELDITSVHPEGKPYVENFDYYRKLGYEENFINSHKELFVSTNIWKEDTFVNAQDLYDEGLKQVAKVAQPTVEVKIQALDTKAMGLNGDITKLELGSCIKIKDEDLGTDILCNVTKRTIDYDNPHILTCDVTSSITYHDTLSKLFTNVTNASNIVTSGGNLVGGQGTTMENVKNYLNLNYLNAKEIEAKYITSTYLQTYYLSAEEIRTHYLDADTIGANYATIANLNAVEAKIKNLDVDAINANFGKYEKLFAQNSEFHKLVASDAEIEDLKANKLTVVGKLNADKAEIDNLIANKVSTNDFESYKATIEKLFAAYATIEYLEANYINAENIEANYAKIAQLDVTNGNIETLKADLAKVQELVVNKANIKDLEAANGRIDSLTSSVANIEQLVASKVDAEYVKAQIVESNKVIVDDLEAIHAVVDVLDTKYATIEQLNAQKANLEELIANKATIDELDAAKATIGNLEALVANINSIMAGNIGTGTLQTIHLTASNVVIDDAIIKSANIEGLDVSKLNAGAISTDKFTIQSDDGGIIISGSTQQFKDKNNKVRLQIGKDAQGNFNFIVFGEDGTTAIYNQNGITKQAVPDGLIVDQMVSDTANIQAKKIQYIDKDGNKTLQTVIEQEQGKITELIKETTIDGSSLKDKYLETVKTVDGMKTTIGDVQTNQTSMSSKITEIETSTEGIKTSVTKAQTTADSAKTTAEQTASKFSWIVNSGTSSTDFTLTDRTAQLVADSINLHGLVTFKGLDSSTQNKIIETSNKIDNLQIGGRNLLLSTQTFKPNFGLNGASETPIKDTDGFYYVSLRNTWSNYIYQFIDLVLGQTYTISFYAKCDSNVRLEVKDDSLNNIYLTYINLDSKDWKLYTSTFVVTKNAAQPKIAFLTRQDTATVYLKKIKLELGDKATDWTPAPEDKANQSIIDNWAKDSVVNGETVINGGYIKTNTIKTDQLAVDDIFATGSAAMNIINAQEINANRITSGQLSAERINVYGLSVLNKDNNQQTFNIANNGEVTIKGSVSSSNYNIGKTGWSINNDGTAEFNDIIARGSVITNDGGIANSGSIRFWAGTSYEERESAPWIVYSDGSMKATQGEFSGVFSGIVDIGNIRIVDPSSTSGGDALLTIQDGGSGLKRIQLTDTNSSIFAQDLIISNNTYSPMVTLKQDGTALFDRGINIGDSKDNTNNVILNKTSLIISNKELTTTSTGFLINSSLDVGSSNNIAHLTVHGDTISDSMTLANELNFGGVVKFTTISNGINIDFVE